MPFRLLVLLSLLFSLPAAAGPEAWSCRPDGGVHSVKTILAGVPAIVRIPAAIARPPILLWHGFGPPASEAALEAALPLDGVPALKIYLGLPLFGDRAPKDGEMTLADRQTTDYGLLLFRPAVMGAVEELPAVLVSLREHGCLHAGEPIGLFGFSASGAAVLAALAEHRVPVAAAVLVNPAIGLSGGVAALERALKRPYGWTPESRDLVKRSDAIGRAAAITEGNPPPALLTIAGTADSVVSADDARDLDRALRPFYRATRQEERLKLAEIAGLGHDWTAPSAREGLNELITDWFERYR